MQAKRESATATQTCLILHAIDMWYEENALTNHYIIAIAKYSNNTVQIQTILIAIAIF
jgi:hypothetical protein